MDVRIRVCGGFGKLYVWMNGDSIRAFTTSFDEDLYRVLGFT